MKQATLVRFIAVCLGLTFTTQAFSKEANLTITVEAGKHDRSNVPVTVPLVLPDVGKEVPTVRITDSTGHSIPGQLTKPGLLAESANAQGENQYELHFILPSLKAGQSTKLTAVLGGEISAENGFRWHDTAGQYTELTNGERPVLRYMYQPLDDSSPVARENTYKVYHHLYDPAGKVLVTKGPGGQYTHHRGLFFGFNKITYGGGKTADVWHATGDAHQSHEDFMDSEAGPVLGRHRLKIDWHGQKKEVFASEEREVAAYSLPGGTLIEWTTRLRTIGEPVKLDGDPQHAGFHFRAAREVGEKTAKQTYYIRPDGVDKPGATINWGGKDSPGNTANQPWKAMSFIIGGKRYTVAYLDRPENPKESRFSERDYGRFGSYFEYTLTEDQPLELRYRVWLQEGETTPEQVAALAADLVEPVKVTVAQ